jgi:hypothetical protein
MFLPTDTPSPANRLTRHDSVFVLVLTLTLLLATSTFFGPFAWPAMVAGVLLSIALHRGTGAPNIGEMPDKLRLVPMNFAEVHVGADAGGLIFVLGSVAILALGLPTLRWFCIGSVTVAFFVAALRLAWNQNPQRGYRAPSLTHGV